MNSLADKTSSRSLLGRPAAEQQALAGSLADYRDIHGRNLLHRLDGFFKWQDNRRNHDLWPYARSSRTAPVTECTIRDDRGREARGINFASQDYLSLAACPIVQEAAVKAIRDYGVHSAGSAALLGNTRSSLDLERALGEFLRTEHIVLYPTGWAAGFGVIQGLVGPDDHLVVDALAHACLQVGGTAATRNLRRFPHNDLAALERRLKAIRATDSSNAILVVTEGLFSMDSDYPDLFACQSLCRVYDATLLVDVAHDLGALGPGGTGTLGIQGLLGEVDLVMGSFSKTFASNGGFVATHRREVKEYLMCYSSPHTFSNALSPAQSATVSAALDIVRGSEGEQRRARLMSNVEALRSAMSAHNFRVGGVPSAIVPVFIGGTSLIRLTARELTSLGVLANMVEYPAVGIGKARFRFQVMADHRPEDMTSVAARLSMASAEARQLLESA